MQKQICVTQTNAFEVSSSESFIYVFTPSGIKGLTLCQWVAVCFLLSLSRPSSSLIFFLTSSLPVLAYPISTKSLLICAGTVCAISRPRPWGWTKEACNTDASLAPQRHRLGTEAGAGANLAHFSSAATSCGICSESPTWHGDGKIPADQCAGRFQTVCYRRHLYSVRW